MDEELRTSARKLNILGSTMLLVAVSAIAFGSLYGTTGSTASGFIIAIVIYYYMTEVQSASTELMVQAYTEESDPSNSEKEDESSDTSIRYAS